MSEHLPGEGIFVSATQLAEAPPEVRQWLLALPPREASEPADMLLQRPGGGLTSGDGLAICTPAEIQGVLAGVGHDYLACQVLFALGCEYLDPATGEHRPRILHFDDFFSRTDVNNGRELNRCLDTIDEALRAVRGDRAACLHRIERHGGIRVHHKTQRVIYQVWRALTEIAAPSTAAEAGGASIASGEGLIEIKESVAAQA